MPIVRVIIFCHSLVSDWNHGNAHFLRGVAAELLSRGHDVRVYEPMDSWSRLSLEREHGPEALDAFGRAYPHLSSIQYELESLDLDAALADADLVIAHEWNEPGLISKIGAHRARHTSYVLLFHDTHHRSITDPASLAAFDLRHYDGVLAFGDAVAHMYIERGWTRRAWTWHEAADTRIFFPHRPIESMTDSDSELLETTIEDPPYDGDVVWIGNFGDHERTAEIDEFLIRPARRLGVRTAVYGVGYPDDIVERLASAGIEYRGWVANFDVPQIFAEFKVTIHIPRGPYIISLPGIPTIRPFEAMACGIPLVSARWWDSGGLFTPGEDFLVARDADEMTAHLGALLTTPRLRASLANNGLETIRQRHTCAHRVDELLSIYRDLRAGRNIPVARDNQLVSL
jgi:spore maturation protein CgeB